MFNEDEDMIKLIKSFTEEDRIRFIMNRGGKDEAINFAKQTLYIYLRETIMLSKYRDSIEYIIKFLREEANLAVRLPGFDYIGQVDDGKGNKK